MNPLKATPLLLLYKRTLTLKPGQGRDLLFPIVPDSVPVPLSVNTLLEKCDYTCCNVRQSTMLIKYSYYRVRQARLLRAHIYES